MPVRSSRRLFLAIALPLVVAATAGYWWSTPRDAALIAGVRVNGSPEFVQQIDAALTLQGETVTLSQSSAALERIAS